MIKEISQSDRYRQQLCYSLQQETLDSPDMTFAKNANIYKCGESDQMIYFIISGRIKQLMRSLENKECLLAIHTTGDIFGELCLSGTGPRLESATAMEETVLKQIPSPKFNALLTRDTLFVVDLVQYLAVRLAEQQQVIANLATVDSEHRLGKTLLRLAHKLGMKNPHGILIELKITHEELSEMVGTTRPRISLFMQRFRNLGLIELNDEHFLIIKENKLTDYLTHLA